MDTEKKLFSIDRLQKFVAEQKQKKEVFVLCHGHFNLIHPGHLRFIQYAKSLGTKLIVAVYSGEYFSKSMPSPYPQEERAQGVATLQHVDCVVVLAGINIVELIELVSPDFFVMGKEFELERRTEVADAIAACEAHGVRIIFHAGEIHYSSVELLHDSKQKLQTEKWKQLLAICRKQKIIPNTLWSILESYSKCRLLIIGDTIVDQYVACDAIGMSAEAPVLVVKEIETREFLGGAAIVASHLHALGTQCHYLSVVGEDAAARLVESELLSQGLSICLLKDSSRPTTFKIRYMVDNQKLFRVSRLQEHSLNQKLEEQFIEKLEELAPHLDGILISDFVYGVITPKILNTVIKLAKHYNIRLFGDLQCSSQVGSVGKFKGFDLICPTEREARIALGTQEAGLDWIANALINQTRTSRLLIKMGTDGFIAYENAKLILRQHFPATEVNPVDVTGAGDALLAAMAASLCSGATLMEASVIGTCMAGIIVQTVGNVPVKLETLRRSLLSLTNEMYG